MSRAVCCSTCELVGEDSARYLVYWNELMKRKREIIGDEKERKVMIRGGKLKKKEKKK